MTDTSDKQLLDIFRDMQKNIATLARQGSMGGGASTTTGAGSRSGSSAIDEAAQEDYEREIRLGTKNLDSHNRAVKNAMKAMRSLTNAQQDSTLSEEQRKEQIGRASRILADSLNRSSKIQEQLAVEYNRLARNTIPEQALAFKNLVKGSGSLSNGLSVSARNSSLLGAALIKRANEIDSDTNSLDYGRYINELTKASAVLPKSLLKGAGVVDEYVDDFGEYIFEFKDNLNADDFAALRAKLGEAEVILNEAFDGIESLGMGNIQEILDRGLETTINQADVTKPLEDAMLDTAVGLRNIGVKIPDQIAKIIDDIQSGVKAGLNPEDLGVLAKELQSFYSATKVGRKGLDDIGRQANTFYGKLKRDYLTAEGLANNLSKKLADLSTFAGTMATLKNLATQIAKVYQEAASFNIAHIPATFLEVQKQSIKMGMGFEDTVKFMQENKRVMGLYGAEAFGSLRSGLETTFNQFGYTFKQAAEVIGPATEAAIASSVNIKDANALNNFMADTMKSFQKISGLVNISAAEYAKLNSELFSSDDVMKNMLGMTTEQTQIYGKQLQQQRDEMVLRGISIQQAQEAIKAQEASKRAKVTERFREGAKMMAQMQLLGFSSEESMKAFRIHTKGRAATAQETEELNRILGQIGMRREQAVVNAGSEQEQFSMEAGIAATEFGGGLEQRLQAQLAAQAAGKANAGATPEEAARAAEAAKANQSMASLGEAVNTVSSLINNSLVSAAGAAGLSLLALAAASGKAAWALNKIRGAGGADLPDGPGKPGGPGKGGKFGKLALGAGKLAAGGLGGLVIGGLASEGSEALANAGHSRSAAAVDLLGTAGSWASMGAALGSIVPGLGTAAGAAIGGVLGAGKSAIFDGSLSKIFASPATLGTPSVAMPIAPRSELTISGEPVNNEQSLQAPNGVLSVKDAEAQQQLAVIAQHMMEAVKLLSEISEAKEEIPRSVVRLPLGNNLRPAIPTSTSYISGRAM